MIISSQLNSVKTLNSFYCCFFIIIIKHYCFFFFLSPLKLSQTGSVCPVYTSETLQQMGHSSASARSWVKSLFQMAEQNTAKDACKIFKAQHDRQL